MRGNPPPAVVCLGFFDGVHLGHQALLRAARKAADEKGLIVVAHTFDRPPAELIRGEKVPEITPLEIKKRLLLACGADAVAVTPFDQQMRDTPGRVFFERALLGGLNCRHVVAGYDHRFGRGGDTGTGELAALCAKAGVGLTVVPAVTLPGGEKISSTNLRRALLAGNVPLAEAMLGRPCFDELARIKAYQSAALKAGEGSMKE